MRSMHSVSARFLRIAAVSLLLFSAAVGTAHAATLAVPSVFPTVQAALDSARTGDVVRVAAGIYTGAGNRDLNFRGKTLVLEAESAAALTVLDCGGAAGAPHRGFSFRQGEEGSVVRGFTIRGGYAPADGPSRLRVGGAVSLVSVSVTFEDCIFESNMAARGGAIYSSNSAARFVRCLWRNNSASAEGGAVYCRGDLEPGFSRCIFAGNNAASGGGVFCDSSTPTFEYCVFARNTAVDGGGITCMMASPVLDHCTIEGNTAVRASGVYAAFQAHPQIENSLITFGAPGEALRCGSSSSFSIACTNIFGNNGGDWTGCAAAQLGDDGNFSSDPLYCLARRGTSDPEWAYFLERGSPCFRGPCGLVGAYGPGCVRRQFAQQDVAAGPARFFPDGAAAALSSWGMLKAQYQSP